MCTKEDKSWYVGLQNVSGKYLTSEDFHGSELNVLSSSLGRKQTWTIELTTEETVSLKNRLGSYITTDKYGVVKCECKELLEEGKFYVDYSSDGSGRWAFRNCKYGKYLSGKELNVSCVSLDCSDEICLWYVPLATHPQVAFYNKRRKQYFGLADDHIKCKDVVPWGPNCLFTLEFYSGKYLIETCDNQYLRKDGSLTKSRDPEARFTLELRMDKGSKAEGAVFMDNEGRYLSGVGTFDVILKTKGNRITDDEIFHLEKSQPQVTFTAANGNMASIKAGFEIAANSNQQTKNEIFQIEFEEKTKKWYIQTADYKFWSVNKNNGIEATSTRRSPQCLFKFEWLCGSAAVICPNGKYLGFLFNNQMIARSGSVGANETFQIRLVNRPLLVLKCEFGFVGKKKTSNENVCNRTMLEVLTVEPGEKGTYYIKGDNGKYWNMNGNMVVSSGSQPQPFVIEFMGQCLMAILAPNNQYLVGEKIGRIRAASKEVQTSCLWQF